MASKKEKCDFCGTKIGWCETHRHNGAGWVCENIMCNKTFCQKCFIDRCGKDAYYRNVTSDWDTELLCPDRWEAKYGK